MIVFAHLLNDRSGSPRVLCSAIAALTKPGDGSRLFVGSDGNGCLSETTVEITRYWYWRTPWRLLTLFTFFYSQLCLFLSLLRAPGIDRNAIIYVNTLLPFGAALYGKLTGRQVVYHLHEVSVSPAPLRWLLTTIARLTASHLIYVSDFHRSCLPIGKLPAHTIHNALEAVFCERAKSHRYQHRYDGNFNVLMLASLRDYKGVPEFVALAHNLANRADIHFQLVVNDDEAAISRYFSNKPLPANVTIYPRTSDPAFFYAGANLLMNLSRPDEWVETFGLTLLEAMAFGVPVIAPPVGGPLELVDDNIEGYVVDCRKTDELLARVLQLADDEALCLRLSTAARQRASHFTPAAYAEKLRQALNI